MNYIRAMFRWVKLLLICAVALTLPMQGVASASKLMCGHGVPMLKGDARSIDEHADPAAHRLQVHDQHDRHGLQGPPAADPAASDNSDNSDHSTHKCSACATCCSFVALPSKALLPLSNEFSSAHTAPAVTGLKSVDVKGPERPPRLLTL